MQSRILNRVGVVSAGRVGGILYALIGFLFGAFVSLFSLLGAAIGASEDRPETALMSLLFGAGAVVILPIFYGVIGFLGGMLGAALYNLGARMVGGVELDIT